MKDIIYVHDWWLSCMAKTVGQCETKLEGYAALHELGDVWREVQHGVAFLLGDTVAAQMVPTLRWFEPREPVPYRWHSDSDEGFGHPQPLYNLWVAVTPVPAGILRTERDRSRALEPGEALLFEGSRPHLASVCDERRVSFDARFVIAAEWYDTGQRSAQAGTPITLGTYYEVVTP